MFSKGYEDKVLAKLEFIDDLMERLVVPYILLGDLAYRAMYGEQSSDEEREVRIGIKEKDWTEFAQSVLPQVCQTIGQEWKKVETGNNIEEYEINGIRVRILKRKLKFLENPQQIIFPEMSNFYMVPNPFDKYWKSRRFVW